METPDEAPSTPNPTRIITDYLQDNSRIFQELDELRRKGWTNAEVDEHFKQQRQRADEADAAQQQIIYNMMCRFGDERQENTGAIALSESAPSILDLCAAPEGFIATALKYNPTSTVCGISLTTALGRNPLLVPHGQEEPRVTVQFLVNYREDRHGLETQPLACSQLIIALQRIQEVGTLIMLPHKVGECNTLRILYAFSGFADLRLFKPKKIHGTGSSFYMIATNVQSGSEATTTAVEKWKGICKEATLATSGSAHEEALAHPAMEQGEEVQKGLQDFGERVVQLAEPIWGVQKAALSKKSWTK